MSTEYAVRLLAGILVLTGLLLGLLVSPWFFILVGFVGLNLVQSSFTGFCPAEMMIRKAKGEKKAEKRVQTVH
jgi:hypothetical protein